MNSIELEQKIMVMTMGNGYAYARLDLAKVLLGLTQEGNFDKRTLDEVSDRMEHIFQMREATGFSLPIEIKD